MTTRERMPIGYWLVPAMLFGIAFWVLAIAAIVWAFSGIFG